MLFQYILVNSLRGHGLEPYVIQLEFETLFLGSSLHEFGWSSSELSTQQKYIYINIYYIYSRKDYQFF